MPYNQNAGYGQAYMHRLESIAANICPTFGRIFVVKSPGDTANKNYQLLEEIMKVDPEGNIRFFTTIEAAYAAAQTNNNDVILVDGNSVHTLATQIAWSKSRVHLAGIDGGGRYTEQGARIQGTVGAAVASLIKVTGTRNTFRNIKFVQNDTDAAAINVVISAGSSTLWQDCSFIFEVTDNLDLTTACEVLIAEAGGTFKRCVFGNDCILSSAARYVTELNAVTGSATGDSPKHNTFIDCMWTIQSSSASAIFFKVTAAKFRNTLINPVFHAAIVATNSAVTLTKAMASIATMTDGCILVVNPACNTTDLCTTSTNVSVVGLDMYNGAGTATTGVGVTPA